MNGVGFMGSQRVNGNNYPLVDYVSQKIQDHGFSTEIVELEGPRIQACRGCDTCRKKQSCTIDDDLMSVFEKMSQADGIRIGCPVYTGSVPGILKAPMERTGCLCYAAGLMLDLAGDIEFTRVD